MTQQSDPTTIEQTATIDAPMADIYTLLADLETIPEYSPDTIVTPSERGVDVNRSVTISSCESPLSLLVTVDVAERAEPTRLTMALDGAIDGTVTWTLQPHSGSTLVTATVTYTVATPAFQETIADRNWSGVDPQSAVVATLPAVLDDVLTGLQTLCEQPSPPASIAAHVDIPEIYCPFPAEISPHLEAVTAHTQEWAQEMGLIDEPSSELATLSGFPCWVHPRGSLEALCLCSDWYWWGFLHDDATDPMDPADMQRYQEPFLAVLNEEPPDSHQEPLVRALADICQRVSARMPQEWYDLFVENNRDYLTGTEWEAHTRASDDIPDLHTFMPNRRSASGARTTFDLMELALDCPLPTDIYQRETVTALREAAANAAAWTNDVYSLQKELAADEVHNLVVVIRHEQGCSVQEAVIRSCELIEAETRRFEAFSQRLTVATDTDAPLQAYITGLEYVLSGNLAWSKETARYGATD